MAKDENVDRSRSTIWVVVSLRIAGDVCPSISSYRLEKGAAATPPRTRARLGFEVMRTSGLREVTGGTALVYTTIEGR
jgi:hypothetical protein